MTRDSMDISIQNIDSKIYTINDTKVMLDSDLAKLYGITTGNLNKAVTRNIDRFPSDFMFVLTQDDFDLIFQNGTSSYGGRRKLPRVFTEQGVSMLSGILKSQTAIKINIQIMRTFVHMRKYALTHDELAKQIEALSKKVTQGEQTDIQIMDILTKLIKKQVQHQQSLSDKIDRKIGFVV